MKKLVRARPSAFSGCWWAFLAAAPVAQTGTYFPPAGAWARKAPAELGLDPAKLAEAVTFAQCRESTRAMDFSDQERINSWDMARFGYLWLRGGKWGDKQILPPAYVKAAIAPSAHGPDYGYLWWLNTLGKNYPGLPTTVYGAGAGSNAILISPEHDLVMVWRCHAGNEAEFAKRVIAAIK